MNLPLVILLALIKLKINLIDAHAYLSEPPSRASAWLNDPDFVSCCKSYDYNQMFCGGLKKQWEQNGGKCGICGDSWDEPKLYEKGGERYLGKIVRTYKKNTPLDVSVHITANHLGHFEFRLCNVDGWEGDATQECLNKTVLTIDNTNETDYKVVYGMKIVELYLTLPTDFTCDHCVLQWKYVAGNSWGFDGVTNRSCVGCGPVQEHFIGCADISIEDPSKPKTTTTTSTVKSSSTSSKSTTQYTSSSSSANISSLSSSTQSTVSIFNSTATYSQNEDENSTKDEYNGCSSKLEFGSMVNLSRVIQIYCYRMCKLKCDSLLNEYEQFKSQSMDSTNINAIDIIACLETCPTLCSCK